MYDHSQPRFTRSSQPNERHLLADNLAWHVYELSDRLSGRGKALIFETEKAARRVRDYPDDWRTLPDAELALLRNRK